MRIFKNILAVIEENKVIVEHRPEHRHGDAAEDYTDDSASPRQFDPSSGSILAIAAVAAARTFSSLSPAV